MRRLFVSSASVLALSLGTMQIASSADRPPVFEQLPAPRPVLYNWTGFYVGGNAGYGWGNMAVANPPSDIDGWFAGGQIGWNWQPIGSPWVLGLEVDSSWGEISRNVNFTYKNAIADAFSQVNYLGTARVRVGYAIDRGMVYGTGGLAWGHHEFGFNSGLGGSNALSTSAATHTGWALGAGFEWALSRNWSMKFEYLYNYLGKENYVANVVPGGIEADLRVGTAKFGLNYMFDWGRGQIGPKF